MKSVLTIGEILVEIMATERGDGFLEPIKLIGPFPSGAPGNLHRPGRTLRSAGRHDRLRGRRRLRAGQSRPPAPRRGRCERRPDRPGGGDGQRLRSLQARRLPRLRVQHQAKRLGRALRSTPRRDAVLERSDHLHVMGTALFSPKVVDIVLRAAESIKARGGTISFDPNLRPEILNLPGPSRGVRNLVSPLRRLSAERRRALSVHGREGREKRRRGNPRPRRPRRSFTNGAPRARAISTRKPIDAARF